MRGTAYKEAAHRNILVHKFIVTANRIGNASVFAFHTRNGHIQVVARFDQFAGILDIFGSRGRIGGKIGRIQHLRGGIGNRVTGRFYRHGRAGNLGHTAVSALLTGNDHLVAHIGIHAVRVEGQHISGAFLQHHATGMLAHDQDLVGLYVGIVRQAGNGGERLAGTRITAGAIRSHKFHHHGAVVGLATEVEAGHRYVLVIESAVILGRIGDAAVLAFYAGNGHIQVVAALDQRSLVLDVDRDVGRETCKVAGIQHLDRRISDGIARRLHRNRRRGYLGLTAVGGFLARYGNLVTNLGIHTVDVVDQQMVVPLLQHDATGVFGYYQDLVRFHIGVVLRLDDLGQRSLCRRVTAAGATRSLQFHHHGAIVRLAAQVEAGHFYFFVIEGAVVLGRIGDAAVLAFHARNGHVQVIAALDQRTHILDVNRDVGREGREVAGIQHLRFRIRDRVVRRLQRYRRSSNLGLAAISGFFTRDHHLVANLGVHAVGVIDQQVVAAFLQQDAAGVFRHYQDFGRLHVGVIGSRDDLGQGSISARSISTATGRNVDTGREINDRTGIQRVHQLQVVHAVTAGKVGFDVDTQGRYPVGQGKGRRSQVPAAVFEFARELVFQFNPLLSIRADIHMELARLKGIIRILEIFLRAERNRIIPARSQGDVADAQVSIRTEEQVVQTRTLIVGIVAVGVGVVAGRNGIEPIGNRSDTRTGLVPPAVELVQIGPAGTGAIGLRGSFLVEVVEENNRIFDGTGRALLLQHDRPVVIGDVEFQFGLTVEALIAENSNRHSLLLVGLTAVRRNGNPVRFGRYLPIAGGIHRYRRAGRCRLEVKAEHVDLDLRKGIILLLFASRQHGGSSQNRRE